MAKWNTEWKVGPHGAIEKLSERVWRVEADIAGDGNRGPDAFGAIIGRLRTAFPDITYTLDELVAEGDRVAARWTWRGTFSGQFRDISPTGERVVNTGLAIFRVAGGKIVAATIETDRFGFLVATGKIPHEPSFGPPPRTE